MYIYIDINLQTWMFCLDRTLFFGGQGADRQVLADEYKGDGSSEQVRKQFKKVIH